MCFINTTTAKGACLTNVPENFNIGTQQYMQSMSRYIFMYRNVYDFEMVNSLERVTNIYLFAVVLDVALQVLCLH